MEDRTRFWLLRSQKKKGQNNGRWYYAGWHAFGFAAVTKSLTRAERYRSKSKAMEDKIHKLDPNGFEPEAYKKPTAPKLDPYRM